MRPLARFVLALSCAPLAWPAAAQSFLPLEVGNRWVYDGAAGERETRDVRGTIQLPGGTPYAIHYTESTQNSGLQNYWTSNEEGDVSLWGFFRDVEGFGRLYEPSILTLDAPLFVGKSWTQTVNVYLLPSRQLEGRLEVTFTVIERSALAVPAGTFDSWDLRASTSSLPPPSGVEVVAGARLGLDGAFLPERSRASAFEEPVDWWSQGVGEVAYMTSDLFRLRSFESPTPIRTGTWSRRKADYR